MTTEISNSSAPAETGPNRSDERSKLDWTEAFFAPESIAIIGASNNPVKISGRPVDYLQRFGYAGRILPINPTRETVQGLPAYPSLEAIEGPIDLAIILTGAESCVQALSDCAERGVPAAIMVAGGFAEIGGEGKKLQDRIEQIAADSGIRVIGPNCTGVLSLANAVTATFSTSLDREAIAEQPLREGSVGLVSQSGGIGGFILATCLQRGLGFSQYFTTGNEADLTVSEIIGLLADRDDVDLIMSYVEGLSDGDVFVESARQARDNGKPVLALKAGRSDQGAAAVSSHTGALASPGRVFDAVADQYGVIQADSMDDLIDAAQVFSAPARPRGRRLTIVSMSGGLAVLAVDAAADHGLTVEPWSDEWAGRMAQAIPAFGNPRNPIDLTASLVADPGLMARSLAVAGEHPETDLILIMIGNTDNGSESIIESIIDTFNATDRPLAVVWAGGTGRPRAALAEAGVPVYADPREAVRALSRLTEWSLQTTDTEEPPSAPDSARAREIISTVRADGRTQLDEFESAQLLAAYGIPSMPSALVSTPAEAAAAAATMDGPVVVKVASDRIAHKSDIGGVIVGLQGDDAVQEAAASVLEAARGISVDDAKVLVQAMASEGLELMTGILKDPVFGPMIVTGIGGTLVEVLDDVRMVHAPVSVSRADDELGRLRSAALFDGVRGAGPYARRAAAEVVARLSVLAVDLADEIAELDVNPLIVGEHDVVAVDGLVVLTGEGDK
jgi:acyl-CoA synthetase (NDP forming)